MHLYELRNNIDQDDWELGIRVASALFGENTGGPATRYDMIVFRAYGAVQFARIQQIKKKEYKMKTEYITG